MTVSVTTRPVQGILTITDREDPYGKQAALLAQFLEPLGMTLDVKELERGVMYNKCDDANAQTTFCARPRLGQGLRRRLHVRWSAVRLQWSVGELLQLQPDGSDS